MASDRVNMSLLRSEKLWGAPSINMPLLRSERLRAPLESCKENKKLLICYADFLHESGVTRMRHSLRVVFFSTFR
jgi:hypothetical protein